MQCLVDRECYCEDGGEIRTKMVVSRRAFKCCECEKEIAPGERFEIVTGNWHAQYSHHAVCNVCLEIRNRFVCGWVIGNMYDDIWDALIDNPDAIDIGCLDDLSPAASILMAAMLDAIFEECEDDPEENEVP